MNPDNQTKEFMSESFSDTKLSKDVELNETMTIADGVADEYTNTIKGASN